MVAVTKLEEAYLIDLHHDGDFNLTKTGDLEQIKGKNNVKQRLFHRLITEPGSMVHRPDYGVGAKGFQGKVGSIDNQRELALRIKDQYEQDPAVEEVTGVRIDQDTVEPGLFTVVAKYNILGLGELVEEFEPFSEILV